MHKANIESNGPYPYPERGSASSSQGQYSFSTPLAHTPTGSSPGSVGAYSTLQRPTSSHSGTPSSAHHQVSSLAQRSPQASHNYTKIPSQPHLPQYHPPQPHTPLGPPSGRPTYNLSHDSLGSYGHQRTLSSGSYSQPHPLEVLPVSTKHLPSERLLSAESRPREQSISVSPKTRIDALPGVQTANATRHQDRHSDQQTHSVIPSSQISDNQSDVSEREIKLLSRRSTSFAIEGLLNEVPINDQIPQPGVTQTPHRTSHDRELSTPRSQTHQPFVPPINPTPTPVDYQTPRSASVLMSNSRVPLEINQQDPKMEGIIEDPQSHPTKQVLHEGNSKHHLDDFPIKSSTSPTAPALKNQPARKKPRLEGKVKKERASPPPEHVKASEPLKIALQAQKQLRKREVPRFAQSVRKVGLPTNGYSTLSSKGSISATQSNANSSVLLANEKATQQSGKPDVNNEAQINGNHVPIAQTERKVGPLGAWEPTILDVEPVEDITKIISDWLFTEVVLKQGIEVGPAGGSASKGAVLEIEAKIGRLIDKNTNDRLRLPVATECIVSPTDPNMRISFESSMTQVGVKLSNFFSRLTAWNRHNIAL